MRRTLLRFQVAIASAAAVVLLALGGTAAAVQAIDNNQAEQAQQVSEKEAHFWQIVAGAGSGSSPTVDVLLARDLQGLSAAQVDDFRGNSNRYGGITDAIGFDPFDETGLDCFECGPLDQGTKDNLALIRSGNLDAVINKTVVEAPDDGMTLTPFGLSIPTTIIIFWMVGGPLSLMGAHYWAKYNSSSTYSVRRFGDLWKMDAKLTPEERRATLQLFSLAPSFWVPYGLYIVTMHKRHDERVREMFPDHVAFLEEMDRSLDRMADSPLKDEAKALRNEVMLELQSQALGSGDRTDELTILMAQLGDVESHLRARREALKELG